MKNILLFIFFFNYFVHAQDNNIDRQDEIEKQMNRMKKDMDQIMKEAFGESENMKKMFENFQNEILKNGSDNKNDIFKQLKEVNGTINYLKKFPEVIWIGPQAEPRINLLMINRQHSFPKKFHSRQQNLQIQLLDQDLRKRSTNMGITYYSLEENIKYNFYEDYLHNGKFTYSDEDHWSAYGEEYFGQKFLKDLIQLSD